MRKRLTNEDVDERIRDRKIERCNDIESADSKIEWRCLRCNNIWQATVKKVATAGTGCPRCSRLEGDAKRRKGLVDFVHQSNIVHSNKYQYQRVDYKNSHTKVVICCPIHGEFSQSPTSHLAGNGCSKCMADTRRDNVETFVKKARLIHGTTYDYSKFVYVGSRTKGIVVCRSHGEFLQSPNVHLSRQAGCPTCDKENRKGSYSVEYFEKNPLEKSTPGYLYVVRLHSDGQSFIKVGVATDVRKRLNYYYGMNKEVLFTKPTSLHEAYTLEQRVLTQLSDHRFFPRHKFDGYTECVKDKQEVLKVIEELLAFS